MFVFVLSDVAQAAQLRENLGMLVWIPSSCLNQTQCKRLMNVLTAALEGNVGLMLTVPFVFQ